MSFTDVFSAVTEGTFGDVVSFVEGANNVDVNVRGEGGFTPLHQASDVEISRYLISKGADVNAVSDIGNTPLHSAACKGNFELVKYLISAGADINARNSKGITPAMMAGFKGYTAMANFIANPTGGGQPSAPSVPTAAPSVSIPVPSAAPPVSIPVPSAAPPVPPKPPMPTVNSAKKSSGGPGLTAIVILLSVLLAIAVAGTVFFVGPVRSILPVSMQNGIEGLLEKVPALANMAPTPRHKTAYEDGMRMLIDKNFDAAIAHFDNAIEIRPIAKYFYARGDAHKRKGEHNTEIAAEKGGEYDAEQDYERALSDYSEAIRLEPNTASYYVGRGELHDLKKDYIAALADYTEAIKLEPEEASHYLKRGDVYTARGAMYLNARDNVRAREEYALAVDDYTSAIRLGPKSAEHYFKRGDVFSSLAGLTRDTAEGRRDRDRAISDYTDAITLDGGDARFYNQRGNAYRHNRNFDAAIADYQTAIRLSPDRPHYHNNLGATHFSKREYDIAIVNYSRAIELAPDNARYYHNRGTAFNMKKDYAAAVNDFGAAVRLDTTGNTRYIQDLERARRSLEREYDILM